MTDAAKRTLSEQLADFYNDGVKYHHVPAHVRLKCKQAAEELDRFHRAITKANEKLDVLRANSKTTTTGHPSKDFVAGFQSAVILLLEEVTFDN